jgi:uncharacterized protein
VSARLALFFLATFALAWAGFFGAALHAGPGGLADPTVASSLLLYGGIFAPAAVALALTAHDEGRAGVRLLLGRVLAWRVRARWYAFALAYMAVVEVSVALLHRLLTGAWPPFGATPWYVMAAAISVSTWVQAGEEIGWRGYALPRLAALLGLGPAAVLLGLIWASWHLPLFIIAGTDTTGQSFPLYALQVTALSVAMAWLFVHTGGSLLLVMIMHASINNTKDIVLSAVEGANDPFALGASTAAWLTLGLLWVAAAFFLVRMPRTLPGSHAPIHEPWTPPP